MSKNNKVDFIGIGAAKSGTSWLDMCLEQHPQINMPENKSLFFFNADYGNQYEKDNWTRYSKGLDWYFDHLPPYEKGKIRGEFGVSYLNDPEAPKRIKKHFPEVKILVSLRNPVDMVYSLYWYSKGTVEIKAPRTFEDAMKKRFYLHRGKYYKYLKRYYKLFPQENIHVILFDDIKNKPDKVVTELYKFLGVDPKFRPTKMNDKVYPAIGQRFEWLSGLGFWVFSLLKKFGMGKVRLFLLSNGIFYEIYSRINVIPKKYPPMDNSTRERLKKFYRRDINKLEKLIDRDLSLWK